MFLQGKCCDVCLRTKRKFDHPIPVSDTWNKRGIIQISQHDSTKCTPFLLMYGREAWLPIDLTQHIGSDSQLE